jgi:hypothetical protein
LIAFDAEIVKLQTQIPSFNARENLFVAYSGFKPGSTYFKKSILTLLQECLMKVTV